MRIQKRLAALAMTLLLCCAFAATAYAHDVPDMSRTGSISATMLYGEEAVGGGSLTIYKVGDVAEEDGNYSFVLSESFAGSGLSLADIESDTLAAALAEYAETSGLTGTTIDIAADGTWTAEELELGLYLVVQYDPAEGYESISPFLVSVPMYNAEAGAYVYEVSAEPKVGTLTEAAEEEVDDGEEEDDTSTTTTDVEASTLPQTGQLNWPVPVLAAFGLVLFLAGWWLHFGSRRKSYAA